MLTRKYNVKEKIKIYELYEQDQDLCYIAKSSLLDHFVGLLPLQTNTRSLLWHYLSYMLQEYVKAKLFSLNIPSDDMLAHDIIALEEVAFQAITLYNLE